MQLTLSRKIKLFLKMKRAKYVIYFLFSLLFAFLTFQSFSMFKAEATFSTTMTAVNTVGFMILWFLSYTAKSSFINKNRVPIIVIPAATIHILNVPALISLSGTNSLGLVAYIISSSGLLYFSYKMSRIEKKI